jgi:hypothetical protein
MTAGKHQPSIYLQGFGTVQDVAALRCDIRVRPDRVTPQPVQPNCCFPGNLWDGM